MTSYREIVPYRYLLQEENDLFIRYSVTCNDTAPFTANKVDRILNTSEILSETRDAIGRSMIKASAEAAVYHKHLGESLITATLFSGVQTLGGAQGQNIALRQSNRQALLTMYESKVASEKTRVFASKPKLVKPLSSNHPVSKPQGQVVQPSQNNTSFRGTKPPRHATSDVRTRHSTGDEPRHLNARQVRAGSNSLLQKVGEFFIGSAHAGELDDFLPIKRTVPIKGNNVKHSKNKKTGSPATANKSTGHEKDPLLDKNSTTKGSSWCTLAFRAFCGDRSPEVLRFQQRNCKSAPSLAKLSDNLQSYRPNKVVKMYGREVREGLVETVTFVSEEATHLFLGETTKTGATIVKVGRFIGEECARLELNEKTKTGQFFRRAATFAREEEARFQSGRPTITGTILSKLTAEDIAVGLGRVSGGALPFGLAGSVVKHGSRVLVLTEASEALMPLYNASKSVLFSRAASDVATIRASSPAKIYHGYGNLSKRHIELLDQLPGASSFIKVHKSVSSPNVGVTGSSQSIYTFLNTNASAQNVLSKETQRLIGGHNRFKSQIFEREGAAKSATSLETARIELKGEQISLAFERGRTYDHITKVQDAQKGLVRHINVLNNRLGQPELSLIERQALQQELSKTSKLLDYTEQFVPRPFDPLQFNPLRRDLRHDKPKT